MPLFGGAGQTGEGREGQTGVEEDAGVGGLGRVLLILGCGGGVVVIRGTPQWLALDSAAGLAGLGLFGGGGLPFVGRLRFYARTAIAGALVPMLVIVVLPSIGKDMVEFWFDFFTCIVTALAGVVGVPADFCAGRSLGIVMLEVVVVGVNVAIRLAAGRADGLCRASGRAAGVGMQLQYLICAIIRDSIRGIVGLEAGFIRFFNTVPRYNRHRVPCGGSVCGRDADGRSGQGLFVTMVAKSSS